MPDIGNPALEIEDSGTYHSLTMGKGNIQRNYRRLSKSTAVSTCARHLNSYARMCGIHLLSTETHTVPPIARPAYQTPNFKFVFALHPPPYALLLHSFKKNFRNATKGRSTFTLHLRSDRAFVCPCTSRAGEGSQ